jgi:hypothetical protein
MYTAGVTAVTAAAVLPVTGADTAQLSAAHPHSCCCCCRKCDGWSIYVAMITRHISARWRTCSHTNFVSVYINAGAIRYQPQAHAQAGKSTIYAYDMITGAHVCKAADELVLHRHGCACKELHWNLASRFTLRCAHISIIVCRMPMSGSQQREQRPASSCSG